MTVSAHGPSELERLLNTSVDGELSDAEEASLQTLLRDDLTARRRYLQFMQLHAELHWDHGAAASQLVSPNDLTADKEPSGQRSGNRVDVWMTLAIAMTTLAAGWLLAVGHFSGGDDKGHHAVLRSPSIASVEIQGTASFRPINGESSMLAGRHRDMTAGTLLMEGESSSAQWQFLDGTTIAVSGDAEVSFSDESHKLLRVRQGVLTAEVQTQPVGAPLVVETPTARVEVLGTVFSLSAEPEQTQVNVAEGRVRLKRLVDGRTVEVPQDNSCVASLDVRDDLLAIVRSEPVPGWHHHFTQPPPERWKGEWLPAEENLPARVRAVPCMLGRKQKADHSPIVHFGITAKKVDGISLGSLPVEGVLRIRLRTQQPTSLQIMLGLNHSDGRFGGNFEATLPHDADTLQHDVWREVILPLADFQPLVPSHQVMASGARPHLILVTTYEQDAGLEVSELAIVESEGGL